MEYQQRRKLFVKERFLEGNRQKWCVVFLIAGSVILGMDAYHLLKDPTPYLTFLTFLAGAFIIGYSGSETMKLFRANTNTDNQNVEQNINENKNITEKKDINLNEQILTNNAKENDYNIQEVNI
jgi:hypothetical protein